MCGMAACMHAWPLRCWRGSAAWPSATTLYAGPPPPLRPPAQHTCPAACTPGPWPPECACTTAAAHSRLAREHPAAGTKHLVGHICAQCSSSSGAGPRCLTCDCSCSASSAAACRTAASSPPSRSASASASATAARPRASACCPASWAARCATAASSCAASSAAVWARAASAAAAAACSACARSSSLCRNCACAQQHTHMHPLQHEHPPPSARRAVLASPSTPACATPHRNLSKPQLEAYICAMRNAQCASTLRKPCI